MYSLTFSIDEINTILHPSEKHRELKAQELTDRDKLARQILADWTKTRLTLWMATSDEFEIFRIAEDPNNFQDKLATLNVLPYIHRTCFSNHKNIKLTATLEEETIITTSNKLKHRPVIVIKVCLTRYEQQTSKFAQKERNNKSKYPPHRLDWSKMRHIAT